MLHFHDFFDMGKAYSLAIAVKGRLKAFFVCC